MTRVGALLVVLAASGLSAACNDELVDEVDASVCKSGLRWIGGNRGSEEMRPGSDCVGCHKDNDGPPLVFGGTVYLDAQSEDRYGEEGKRNCFGLEGVTVTVTGADGKEFVVTTNRAGNFFFEGQEEELVKPYGAKVDYVFPDGTPSSTGMVEKAIYGGCARCHGQNPDPDGPPPPMREVPMVDDGEGGLRPATWLESREAITGPLTNYITPSPIFVQSPRP